MRKKALFIGGTGTISTAITARVAAEGEWELTLLNRGSRPEAVPAGVRIIQADINDEADTARKLAGLEWDCVCDFIGFVPAHPELQEPDPAFDAWCDRVIAAMEQAKASLR